MHRFIKAVGAGAKRARALERGEAREAMQLLVTTARPEQVGAFLLALRMKGETAAELAGFADGLSAYVTRVEVPVGTLAVDAHGDGHEGVVSLLPAAACAAAACGVPVWLDVDPGSDFARHGLDGGLDAVGLGGALSMDRAAADIARRGVAACALAESCPPLHRLVALRPLLGVRTVAHTLAKLITPAASAPRLAGSFHAAYVEPLAAALALLGARGLVVQALGGLPEARAGKIVRVATAGEGAARIVDLRSVGAPPLPPITGDPDAAARAANRAALDGISPFAEHAAAAAALMLHAATSADPLDAAARALARLRDGTARAHAV